MNLEKFIKGLQEFAAKNPEALQLPVIIGKYEEGDYYESVVHPLNAGQYIDKDTFKPILGSDGDINAVCVNGW